MFRRKIFIIIFLFSLTFLFAQPLKLSKKFDPMDRDRLDDEFLTSSATRGLDTLNCSLVGGWFRGPSYDVFVVDTLAYIGAGQFLKILNVKDSTNPVLVGEVQMPSYVSYVFVKDAFAYVVVLDELHIIDVSNPSEPAEVGFCDGLGWTPSFARDLYIQDTLAYVTAWEDGLHIIDISDPSYPAVIGSCNTPWRARGVCVQDTIAYVADWGGGLRIIDVSDPSSPDEIVVYNDTLSFSQVYVHDTLAYAAGYDSYIHSPIFISIINVANPSLPVKIGSYNLNLGSPYDIWGMCIQDSLAYLAVGSMLYEPDSCGLYIVNIADPAFMNEVGNYLTGGGRAVDVCVKDNLAYVSCCASSPGNPEGLIIIDVFNPSFPSEVGEYDTYSWIQGVWVKDSFAYVANRGRGLNIINISDPSLPFEVGFCDTPVSPERVFVKDTFAYVADWGYGLRIINVANPFSPREVGFCDTRPWSSYWGPYGVWVQDTFAYLAKGDSGLCIINVSEPSDPTEVGFYNTPGGVNGVCVRDTLAYLAAGDGLYIINVSDPSSLTEVGSFPRGFGGLFIKDTLAYAIGGSLRIIDISDPSLPVEVGSYNFSGGGADIWVQDNLAYIAYRVDYGGGLYIIDVSDPSSPNEVGFYSIGDSLSVYAYDVYVQDSLIYLAYGRAGLYILKYTGPNGGIEEISTKRNGFNITSITGMIEINYSVIAEKEKVKIEIFNILGQKVACPVDGIQSRGNYTLNWNVKTGIYFVRMEIGEKVYSQKVLLVN